MNTEKLERDLADLMRIAERNRQNAQRSTGPKTAEGKAASRMNAVRHGLCATITLVLPGEDAAAFERLEKGIYDSFKPADVAEEVLVDQYIGTAWKLRRIADAEEALNQREIDRSKQPRTIGEQLLSEARDPSERPRMQLMAMEDRLQRMLGRTLRQLKKVRSLREARRAELPQEPVMPVEPPKPSEEAQPASAADVKRPEMPANVHECPVVQNEARSDAVVAGQTKAFVQNEATVKPVEPRIRTPREIAGY